MTRAALLSILSGAMLALSFPDFSWFPLVWIALVPYLYVCFTAEGARELVVGHLLFCAAYFGGLLYWIPRVLVAYGGLSWLIGGLALVVMVLVLALLLAPFPLLVRWTAGRSWMAAALAAPGIWLMTELIRNAFPFGGFPWGALGYSQLPYSWVAQLADVGSVYLISFLVVLVNSAIFMCVFRRAFRFGALVAVLLGLVNLYGLYRVYFWVPQETGRVVVGVAQADIALQEVPAHYATKYFKTLAGQFDEAVRAGARWIVFPEAQNPYRFERDFYFREFWSDRVRRDHVYLLFNSTRQGAQGYYNSAYLLDPDGRPAYEYDKVHLVPFGEYLPLAALFGRAHALVAEVSGFTAGTGLTIGHVGSIPFTTLICYEGIFPELARSGVRQGAQVLVNITNDGWFGPTAAPAQHLQMTAMRAIENRRTCIRAANSGYSAIIGPKGRILMRTGLFQEALLVGTVTAFGSGSPFLTLGFGPCYLAIMVSLVLVFLTRTGIKQKEKEGAQR